jgi:hypothetical protein
VDSTIVYLEKSINANLDSTHRANVLKYYGLILGNKFKLMEALIYNDSSRKLFIALGNKSGEAVVDFDAAQIYFSNGDVKMCEYYLGKSQNFWRSNNAYSRMFIMNVFGMKLANQKRDSILLNRYIFENDSLSKMTKIYQQNLDTFNHYKLLFKNK